jgi:hypothetical protein
MQISQDQGRAECYTQALGYLKFIANKINNNWQWHSSSTRVRAEQNAAQILQNLNFEQNQRQRKDSNLRVQRTMD